MKLYTTPTSDLVRICLWMSEDRDGYVTIVDGLDREEADNVWNLLVCQAKIIERIASPLHDMVALTWDWVSPTSGQNLSDNSERILVLRNKGERAEQFFWLSHHGYTEEEI